MSPIVYLIRHAESIANAGLPSSDPETIPLTLKGHEQSVRLAQGWLKPPDMIVASPLVRAQQTAVPLRERFYSVPFEIWPVQEFVFFNLKHSPPTTGEERKALVEAYWQRCDPDEKHPDAESFSAFWERVGAFQQLVEQFEGERLVVVTHGFFMRAFEWGRIYGFGQCSRDVMQEVHAWLPPRPYTNTCVCEYAG